MIARPALCMICILFGILAAPAVAVAQTLERRLASEAPQALAAAARSEGDARRGAVLFHQAFVGCARCHSLSADASETSLGPNLALLNQGPETITDEHLVESVLSPSKSIRRGFETLTVVRKDGTVLTGLRIRQDDTGSELRDPSTKEIISVPIDSIEDSVIGTQSVMPAGVVNNLAGRQQFLDLIRYLIAVRDGGPERAAELQPPAALVAFQVPEYESHIDHAGLLRSLDDAAFERGEAIYSRLCVNCHGTRETPGSLPTALRFAEGRFKNGSDPFAMYQTLTHGFGLMTPQTWMVPQQKYDVIHYIRESLLKPHNPAQYREVSEPYLASLPAGDTFGPEPVEFSPWSDMDYGPWMFGTFEIGNDGRNIAYKGLAVRLDPGPGGVSRGNQWMLFDHDTMRIAGVWSHDDASQARFINWQGIHFDGRHQAHPRTVGRTLLANPTGPGWADPKTGSFEDDRRVVGRDGRRYGPLPGDWASYHGLHHAGDQVIASYTIGDMPVLESFATLPATQTQVALRTLELGPTETTQHLLIATGREDASAVTPVAEDSVRFGTPPGNDGQQTAVAVRSGSFDGSAWLELAAAAQLDTAQRDFTVAARIRTRNDGVVFCRTTAGPKWVPNGTMMFIRNGRLCYDIGWVGVVETRKRVADGEWHDIAVTWSRASGKVTLVVDGAPLGQGVLAPREPLPDAVTRIGYGTPNFPSTPAFRGDITHVRFYHRVLSPQELTDVPSGPAGSEWQWHASETGADQSELTVVRNAAPQPSEAGGILAGLSGDIDGMRFERQGRRLVVRIPPSKAPRQVTVWVTEPRENDETDQSRAAQIAHRVVTFRENDPSLSEQIRSPAQPLWPETLTTVARRGESNASGFAVDVLTSPDPNPWLARLRFGGLDFFEDGDRMAVCAWDGDVYEVSGLAGLEKGTGGAELKWRRIASGLFQPLGIRIVEGTIYLTCRDQIVILRDSNADGATDLYECFNNDQQVTEHFHEFAMGLQRDADGNFYYAKSARHALTAVVPQHGTLLRVPPDGSRTDILATGFRAANGVCLNPDGSFIVTDQEGHWNPKNRINWVTEGGFYGNMYGYHDVTDESDEAMRQPLCWITNSFDRSPSELLWVDSPRWGNLNGSLLNFSYGYGKVYTVPYEKLPGPGRAQGGMCELPIAQFPTGTMRGRFHPEDGQLYICGLFAWASSQQAREGGLFRLRYTGADAVQPVSLAASPQTLSVTFSDPLDAEDVADPERYSCRVWALKRTKNYGSQHYDEHEIAVTGASLSADGKTLLLTIPELAPTWCYELRCRVNARDGRPVERIIHGTIHELPARP